MKQDLDNILNLSTTVFGGDARTTPRVPSSITTTANDVLQQVETYGAKLSATVPPAVQDLKKSLRRILPGKSQAALLDRTGALVRSNTIVGAAESISGLTNPTDMQSVANPISHLESAISAQQPIVSRALRAMADSELVAAVSASLYKLPITAVSLGDRTAWIKHYLTLYAFEGAFDPFASLYATKGPGGLHFNNQGRGRLIAFGSLGWLESYDDAKKRVRYNVWKEDAASIGASPLYTILDKFGYWQYFTSRWRVDRANLVNPGNFWGIKEAMEIWQYSISLYRLRSLASALAKYFVFSAATGWVPRSQAVLASKRWREMCSAHDLTLRDYFPGRQLILSTMHINGPGFLTPSQMDRSFPHSDRFDKDPAFYVALSMDPRFSTALQRMLDLHTALPFSGVQEPASQTGEPSSSQAASRVGAASSVGLTKLPQVPPYPVTSRFGLRRDPTDPSKTQGHSGVDLAAPYGAEILAPRDGTVVMSGYSDRGGHSVKIDHGAGVISGFAHLSKRSVKQGQAVKKGQVIGYVGNSGSHTTGTHLHLTVRLKGNLVDPLNQTAINLSALFPSSSVASGPININPGKS